MLNYPSMLVQLYHYIPKLLPCNGNIQYGSKEPRMQLDQGQEQSPFICCWRQITQTIRVDIFNGGFIGWEDGRFRVYAKYSKQHILKLNPKH